MNKKNIIIAVVLLVAAALAYFLYLPKAATSPEQEIRSVVGSFSERMKLVPLSGTDAETLAAIKEQYGPFISAGLLTGWEMNPKSAPGKTDGTSSPSHIEILAIELTDDGAYEVQGKVIETYDPPRNGQQTSFYQVAMKLRLQDGAWKITGMTKQLPIQ